MDLDPEQIRRRNIERLEQAQEQSDDPVWARLIEQQRGMSEQELVSEELANQFGRSLQGWCDGENRIEHLWQPVRQGVIQCSRCQLVVQMFFGSPPPPPRKPTPAQVNFISLLSDLLGIPEPGAIPSLHDARRIIDELQSLAALDPNLKQCECGNWIRNEHALCGVCRARHRDKEGSST